MDGHRFDELARTLARPASRRQLLRGAAASAAGGLLALLGIGKTDAAASCRPAPPTGRPTLGLPWPSTLNPHLTCPYGCYLHQDQYCNSYYAADFAVCGAFDVLAAASGNLYRHDEAGAVVLFIKHNDQWQTRYMHLFDDDGLIADPNTGKPVANGNTPFWIEAGTKIGNAGNTGISVASNPQCKGIHLHFELRGGAASPTCAGSCGCGDWSYPIPELPYPQLAAAVDVCPQQQGCASGEVRCRNECCASGFCLNGDCCPEGTDAICAEAGGQVCADTRRHARHCGGCGVDCNGTSCNDGVCCPPEQPLVCDGACVDTAFDPVHCGFCDNPCASGFCLNGQCCPAGTTSICSVGGQVYCADLTSDPNNCGGCGTVCPSGQCISGACTSVDLEVLGIESLSSPVCAGSAPIFRADIRNNGSAPSGAFAVQWIDTYEHSFFGGHASIPAGAVHTHDHVWGAPGNQPLPIEPGQHTLTFIADAFGAIPEGNEADNQQTISFEAIACDPSFAAASDAPEPTPTPPVPAG